MSVTLFLLRLRVLSVSWGGGGGGDWSVHLPGCMLPGFVYRVLLSLGVSSGFLLCFASPCLDELGGLRL